MTLAEHIIEATPDRIKRENFVPMESPLVERTDSAAMSTTMSWLASYLADVDHLPSAAQIRSARAVLPAGVWWCEHWGVSTDVLAHRGRFSDSMWVFNVSTATKTWEECRH